MHRKNVDLLRINTSAICLIAACPSLVPNNLDRSYVHETKEVLKPRLITRFYDAPMRKDFVKVRWMAPVKLADCVPCLTALAMTQFDSDPLHFPRSSEPCDLTWKEK